VKYSDRKLVLVVVDIAEHPAQTKQEI
jgi:hypothetical protein